MTQKQEIEKVNKNLKEQVRYWKSKCDNLEIKLKDLETYRRGMVDAIYYLGGRKI